MVMRPPTTMGTVRQLGSQLWHSRAVKLPLAAACSGAHRGHGGGGGKGGAITHSRAARAASCVQAECCAAAAGSQEQRLPGLTLTKNTS